MDNEINVIHVPRDPFLPHSHELFQFLMARMEHARWTHVLEIGCGPASVLPAWLMELNPETQLTQIDAQHQLVELAAKHTTTSAVMQMLASNMDGIRTASQDVVVAMSVFDQNPRSVLPQISSEIKRVLREKGFFVYIHNEELNLPAIAASTFASSAPPRLLLLSDAWQPDNQLDYCSVSRAELEPILRREPSRFEPLIAYLRGIYPQLYAQELLVNDGGKVGVPYLRNCTVTVMQQVRECVRDLRQNFLLPIVDHSTFKLLRSHIEEGMLSPGTGLEVVDAAVFEIRRKVKWRECFSTRPSEKYFVRGLSRSGYASFSDPQPVANCNQHLNQSPQILEDDLLLVAYQYGLIARRV